MLAKFTRFFLRLPSWQIIVSLKNPVYSMITLRNYIRIKEYLYLGTPQINSEDNTFKFFKLRNIFTYLLFLRFFRFI